uniref:Uncharacterized protein n=1 Tax=Arundo donax TaxID=35708 RepID=A0A0A9GCM1_ARUDO
MDPSAPPSSGRNGYQMQHPPHTASRKGLSRAGPWFHCVVGRRGGGARAPVVAQCRIPQQRLATHGHPPLVTPRHSPRRVGSAAEALDVRARRRRAVPHIAVDEHEPEPPRRDGGYPDRWGASSGGRGSLGERPGRGCDGEHG